jgi:hypothetical protein
LTIIPERDGVAARPAAGFTLHIGFSAPDSTRAQMIARDLAEGLGRLRRDVDMCSARVFSSDESDQVTAVFCGAMGPDGERCMDEPDHGGEYHDEGGVDSRVWSDHDRPEIWVR